MEHLAKALRVLAEVASEASDSLELGEKTQAEGQPSAPRAEAATGASSVDEQASLERKDELFKMLARPNQTSSDVVNCLSAQRLEAERVALPTVRDHFDGMVAAARGAMRTQVNQWRVLWSSMGLSWDEVERAEPPSQVMAPGLAGHSVGVLTKRPAPSRPGAPGKGSSKNKRRREREKRAKAVKLEYEAQVAVERVEALKREREREKRDQI